LANLGHEVARGTIANILKEHGLEPSPERPSPEDHLEGVSFLASGALLSKNKTCGRFIFPLS
jgi:hypothetical protein